MNKDQIEAVADKAWELANEPETDFEACVLLKDCAFTIKELQSRLESLEKDAARLDFLQTTNVDEEGLRYEVNCFVVDGKNQFTIYDEAKEGFISREWSSDFRNAIDTAMQANKGE